MSADMITTIGDVAEVFDGPHATPQKIDNGPYFLSISSLNKGALDLSQSAHLSEEDFKRWTKRVTPQPSDILFSYETRLGEAAMLPSGVRACLGRRMGLLRPNQSKVLPEYLLYAYLSPDFQSTIAQRKIHGATVDRIALKELPSFPVRIPSFEEQHLVVDNLKVLDAKIQLNHRINQTLEQMAQALFKSWFVDFEPVKAKIAALEAGGNDEDALLAAMESVSGKTADQLSTLSAEHPERYAELRATAELFPSAMQDSELGEIPEGWETAQIGQIIQRLKPSKRYTKKQVASSGEVPVYEQGSSIFLGYHDDEPGFTASAEQPLFIFGDHTCVTHLSCQSFDISQNVIPLKGSIRPTVWTYYSVIGKQSFQEYRRHWSEFIIKPVVVPALGLCQRFSSSVTSGLLLKESLNNENKQLEDTRDTLLPKLLSGELTLPDADEAQRPQDVAHV